MSESDDGPGGIAADLLVSMLRERIANELSNVIPTGPVSLVDFPDHPNVGDSAIWLGEMAWLDDTGRTPAYSASLRSFCAELLESECPTGPILIHGGGNFGTTWPKHEAFRLQLLRRFPGRPVIQLPQSIHYDDPASAAPMEDAIRHHGAFTLLVRDAESADFAQRHFSCDVRLCPDSAIYLGVQPRSRGKSALLALMRTDHERVVPPDSMPAEVVCCDWLDESQAVRRWLRVRARADRFRAAGRVAAQMLDHRRLAAWRLERGLAMLSQARAVITDRLHAHILCLLLDIPHVALDNHYGKLARFAGQWSGSYRGFHQATSIADAVAIARRILAE